MKSNVMRDLVGMLSLCSQSMSNYLLCGRDSDLKLLRPLSNKLLKYR